MNEKGSFKNLQNILQNKRMENNRECKNIIFLVDDKSNVWELLRRNDLSIKNLNDGRDISSYKEFYKDKEDESDFYTIQIETNETSSVDESDLDISRLSDLNISNFIKDNLNQI
jgi:hypothetical protein